MPRNTALPRFAILEGATIVGYRDATSAYEAAQQHANSYYRGAYADQNDNGRYTAMLNGRVYLPCRGFTVKAIS